MNRIPKNKRLYNQALEILKLSRSISGFLAYDLSELDEKGNEQEAIYFTGDMVMHSDALAPSIIAAENELFQDDRMRHAVSVEHVTQKLLNTCERLERAESNGREFLSLLRKELKKFNRLQQKWVLTL
ncbi:hypothetical protein [Flavimarina sp. Hel_I_48]|uniref:hypothetical protein n=1 Tax=Flavimarina sp. Hel_I_48 TaxID=1392488 RepID=UPI0004DF1C8C|nr:hypothetical protein [Flavimarina sp. Hel_I_48]